MAKTQVDSVGTSGVVPSATRLRYGRVSIHLRKGVYIDRYRYLHTYLPAHCYHSVPSESHIISNWSPLSLPFPFSFPLPTRLTTYHSRQEGP